MTPEETVQDKENSALEQLSAEHIGDLDAQQVISALSWLPVDVAKATIRTILFRKKCRPNSLTEQYWLLRWIGDQTSLSLAFQLNAKIAASHKSMEASLDGEAKAMIPEILSVIEKCEMLNQSNHLREDRVHVTFSALTVLWHLYLFLGLREEFFQVGERSVRVLEEIDDSQIGRSFYQACSHVARCMAVAYLSGLHKDDKKLLDASVHQLNRAYMLAMKNSFDHPVVFKEFMGSTQVYHEVVALRTQRTMAPCSVSGESLLRCAVRPENPEKVNRLLENFRAFEAKLVQA